MCGDTDYYYTTLQSTEHRARKEHKCCACHESIHSGERYIRTWAVGDDGEDRTPERYKHCLRCWAVLTAVRRERPDDAIAWKLDCGEDWLDTIGELPEEIARLAFLSHEEAQQLEVTLGSYRT